MDEEELEAYEALVFNGEYLELGGPIIEQLYDEEGAIPGCYHVLPAKSE